MISTQFQHNSDKFHRTTVKLDKEPFIFECGRFAKQAGAAIWASWGESVVLVTACSGNAREGIDFFPLTCEYLEKTYAAGRIPGGFFKRETKPRDAEILNARIIDRSIRPMFPDGFTEEVQVVATVVSHDGIHDTDMLALNAASMALHLSSLPFSLGSGPIAGVRVGRVNGKLIAQPTLAELALSDLDIKVSTTKTAVVMVEGGASEVSEEDLVEALFFAQKEGLAIIEACEDMRANMGKEKTPFVPPVKDEALFDRVKATCLTEGLPAALAIKEKMSRYKTIAEVSDRVINIVKESLGEEAAALGGQVKEHVGSIKKALMRGEVLEKKVRIDGRGYADIRPICCEVGLLPRAHGSAMFTRGETQGLVSVTLGTSDDEQKIDGLNGESFRKFMLHYNFPPFCVGEARMLRGTSRREIGHGALAERALAGMIPVDDEKFPYSLRVVSEILESNGSSSMATVCGGTLAMFDAGIKLRAPVAGIAMGMIKEGERFAVLSDILGDEDHLGDMDFKVCGTENGITAIQMDIKLDDGLSRDVLTKSLEQARLGRLHILREMAKALPEARAEISPNAPRIHRIKVNPDKIRDIIGPGGRIIRDIVSRSGAKVEVSDDGVVQIAGVGKESVERAIKIIEDITREAEIGRVYQGIVRRVVDFGAFIELFAGTEGLCHISELSDKRVEKVTDILQEGDEVTVGVLNIDREGKIRLSRRKAMGLKAGDMIS